jgi:hypothetical protein
MQVTIIQGDTRRDMQGGPTNICAQLIMQIESPLASECLQVAFRDGERLGEITRVYNPDEDRWEVWNQPADDFPQMIVGLSAEDATEAFLGLVAKAVAEEEVCYL